MVTTGKREKAEGATGVRGLLAALGLEHVDDFVFAASCALILTSQILWTYTFFAEFMTATYVKNVRIACVVGLVVSELLALKRGVRWSWRSVAALAVIAVMMICVHFAQRAAILWMLPFVFCARNRKPELSFAVIAVAFAGVLAASALCSHFGLIRDYTTPAPRVRHYEGLRYAYAGSFTLVFTCCVVLTRKRRIDFYTLVALFLLNVQTFIVADTRLCFGVAIAVLLVALVLKLVPEGHRFSVPASCAMAACVIIPAVASVAITVKFDPTVPWMAQLNTIFGLRLSLGHDAFVKYGPVLFGQPIKLVGAGLSPTGTQIQGDYNFIDFAYIQLLVYNGVAYMVLFVGCMAAACYKGMRTGCVYASATIVIFAFHGMVDNQLIYPWMNPMMFFAFWILFGEGRAGRAEDDRVEDGSAGLGVEC